MTVSSPVVEVGVAVGGGLGPHNGGIERDLGYPLYWVGVGVCLGRGIDRAIGDERSEEGNEVGIPLVILRGGS